MSFTDKDTRLLLQAYDKKMGASDLLYFANNILNYKDTNPTFHKEFCNFIVKPARKKLGLLPRGHLKTTLGTICYSMFRLIKNKHLRVLIASNTWDNARKILSEIRGKFESDRFMEIYGDLRGLPWNDDEIRLTGIERRKEPSITTTGLERTITGLHFDLIILDDLVSRDNIGTMEQIDKVKMYYRDILDILEPNGEVIIWGTRWHYFDMYGWMWDKDNPLSADFQKIKHEIIEDGKFIYPEKFNRKFLDEQIRSKGNYEISCQYYNNPVPDEERIFKLKGIMNYWQNLNDNHYVFVCIDPASSKKKDSDFTGIVVVAAEPNRKLKVIEAIQKKMNTGERVNEYLRIINKYRKNLRVFGIEKVGFQESDIFFLQQKLNEDSTNRFYITELRPKQQSKLSRIEALQPFFERGDIQILPEHTVLQKQLLDFPKCDKFDVADALAYILEVVYYPYGEGDTESRDMTDDEEIPVMVWTKGHIDRSYERVANFKERHPFSSLTNMEIRRIMEGDSNYGQN